MASESVVAEGLEYLLEPLLVPKDPALTIKAASNVRASISPGIAAIGDLLWQVSSSKDLTLDRATAFDIGVLIKMLSQFNDALTDREVNAYECLINPAAYAQFGGSATSLNKGC